jgi:two-component system LytT family response regulator
MNAQLDAIIVDDEAPAREVLQSQIQRHCPFIRIIDEAPNARIGYDAIVKGRPHVVFVDIRMPFETGLDLIDRFENRDFYVVFYTTYQDYAIDAIRRQAFDYLLKPVDIDDLKACAERIQSHYQVKMIENGDYHRKLEITTSGQRHFIRHSEILHIEASGSYACIYKTDGKRLMVSKNLKYVENLIDNPKFVRVHNSQLVHLNKVKQCNYRTNALTLVNGKEIKLAVRKKESLRRQMAEFDLNQEEGGAETIT